MKSVPLIIFLEATDIEQQSISEPVDIKITESKIQNGEIIVARSYLCKVEFKARSKIIVAKII